MYGSLFNAADVFIRLLTIVCVEVYTMVYNVTGFFSMFKGFNTEIRSNDNLFGAHPHDGSAEATDVTRYLSQVQLDDVSPMMGVIVVPKSLGVKIDPALHNVFYVDGTISFGTVSTSPISFVVSAELFLPFSTEWCSVPRLPIVKTVGLARPLHYSECDATLELFSMDNSPHTGELQLSKVMYV